MGKGTLTIYSASAGSGKTYKLTGIYLTSLFRSGKSYRKILAVTFTNKATAEMKYRILDHLFSLASGKESDYLPQLIETTGKTEDAIRLEAREILFSILHDFSRFSVSTIDAFFQKVIRTFTREAGLHSGFNVELDHDLILSKAIDNMIASAGNDEKLKSWLTAFVMSNLDEEKSWNLKKGIKNLSRELFNEKFKILSEASRSKLEDKDYLIGYIKKIRDIRSSFEKTLLEGGRKCEKFLLDFNLKDEMFYYKGRGVPGFIRNLSSGNIKDPNTYVRAIFQSPPRWSSGKPAAELKAAIDAGLEVELKEILSFYDSDIVIYNSAIAVLSDIYALGILSDVLKKIHAITSSENKFLLSDSGEFLKLITGQDQAPFIYEKTGSRYENFMIDEFQDTSIMQWENFEPLIKNSMAEGSDNLVVGDVKQSIYRWRNSDWRILDNLQESLVDNERFFSVPLKTNWRSRPEIIQFNNALFTDIPSAMDDEFPGMSSGFSFKRLFAEAVQDDPGKKQGGYVRLEFIEDDCADKKIIRKWNDKVLERLPGVIESFQDKGFSASDIGILVRDGREGSDVIKKMISYSNSCTPEKKEKYNYNIVSSDSLLLNNSDAINFIIAVISVIDNPSDMISRAKMLRTYLLSKCEAEADKASLKREDLMSGNNGNFPAGYENFLNNIKDLPVFEATEKIISFFGLGNYHWNVAYLNAFQDCVLNFTGNMSHGFKSFLEWWESTGRTKSVILSENQDAARVLTIHKSKGLEFSVVLLPFLSWNIDHKNSKQPFLWVNPDRPPFNEIGIVPVKYKNSLPGTIFRDDYLNEKFSAYLDNINLLYVAMTRAKDAIFGFIPENASKDIRIAEVLKNSITGNNPYLSPRYDRENKIFESGSIICSTSRKPENKSIKSSVYPVIEGMKSLRLKLHGESYFSGETNRKINYGKLMHEVFESIITASDIPAAVRGFVIEGKISENEAQELENRIKSLIDSPPASEWFQQDNKIITEAEILVPSGSTRRPDRIIFRDDRTIIIDFKFGEENPVYRHQIVNYRKLLNEMGYPNVEGYLWYVDKNQIVSV